MSGSLFADNLMLSLNTVSVQPPWWGGVIDAASMTPPAAACDIFWEILVVEPEHDNREAEASMFARWSTDFNTDQAEENKTF